MLTVAEALQHVLQRARPRPANEVAVVDAVGLALAEDVASDVDSPPYDKSLVDGYAVLAGDLATGAATLRVIEEVTAGAVPSKSVQAGEAVRIMTGAPLPAGADAVVMVEQTAMQGDDRVRIECPPPAEGGNILRRATSLERGQVVCAAGRVIRPIEVGLLSEVGRERVRAVRRPRVAVLATGNELVPAGDTPGPGQIRNSNGPMLTAAAAAQGAITVDLGVARDEQSIIESRIRTGLGSDVLLISGGVSAGVLDLVPAALEAAGVRQVFHKVQLKPGKPLWFGVQENPVGDRLVFGLPGNPISSFVCFHLFVRPALAQLAGVSETLSSTTARLAEPFTHRGGRPTYHPAVLRQDETGAQITPTTWRGSADIRGFADANCLAVFPAGDAQYAAGVAVEVIVLD
jgi:molybdopterin molybdotransferase